MEPMHGAQVPLGLGIKAEWWVTWVVGYPSLHREESRPLGPGLEPVLGKGNHSDLTTLTATICMILNHRITLKASKSSTHLFIGRVRLLKGLSAWPWSRTYLYISLSHRKLEPSGMVILLTRLLQHRRKVGLWRGKQYRLHLANPGCTVNHSGWLLDWSLGQVLMWTSCQGKNYLLLVCNEINLNQDENQPHH